ncbi:hypothetical protein C2S52_014815 [Perilla frutescens var. hirtella]|nr:hypothetical protein C2S52_014815 [Perilla frutescens var. hirtella]
MDPGKHGNSDASSPDQNEEKSNDESAGAGVGRSYECTFCKRGFTNAQALGGHMNIHRKDKAKAKAKQKNQEEASNKSSNPNSRYLRSPPLLSADHQQQTSYHRAAGGQINYQVYLPSSNPNFQTENYMADRFDANLSLRIGASLPPADEDGEGNVKENDVDLELRLGHHP